MSQKMDAAEMLTVVAHKKEKTEQHAAEEDQHAAQQQRLKQELQLFNNNSSNGMAITVTNGFGVTAAAQSASQREHRRQQQQQSFYHKKTAKRVELAKRKARSELQKCGWQSVGYAFDTRWLDTRPEAGPDTIERVDASRMSYEQFVDRYERPGKPVILLGLTEAWRANQRWTMPLLLRGYRNQKFKCGEDDDGYSVKLKMKYYVHYASTTQDDSPLYIFDSGFGDRPKTAKLLEDYEVPHMFKDDLFRYATDRRRPPHRWFVMGPARSGTAIHIDPLGTSAWNALVVGHKKWCLIHPTAPKLLVKPTRDESGPHPSEAVNWFNTVYRRVLSPQWPSDQFPVIHAVQAPGEVMFVPSGWWHVVMNLNSTIAVTQNFCSISNLPKVWPKTVKSRPQLAVHWLKALRAQRPELGGPLIEAINRSNGIPPLVVDEPCDSSSSSSSSDGSDSESEDGEDIGQQQQKQPIPASISHTNSNGQQQQQELGHGLGQHGHHQHRHNQTQQHHQNQSHHRGSGQQHSSAAAGETNGNGNVGPMRGGGVDGECEPAVINQAVADAQRIAIVRFVDQSAADEQQMGEASEEKFGRQQNGRNNNNHAAAAAAGGEAESSGQAHAKKRKHCSTSSSNHQQQQQRHRSLPAAYQQQNSNHNNH